MKEGDERGTKIRIAGILKHYTSRPFTPSKILVLAAMALFVVVVLFVLLYAFGIITPLSIANLVIGFIGEDVEVTEINDTDSYSDHIGLRILEGEWGLVSETEEKAFFSNGTAEIALTYIEKSLEDERSYLDEHITDMKRELDKGDVVYFSQESTMCGHRCISVISESGPHFMTTVWYCDVQERIYIMSALYDDRNDVQNFMLNVECHWED